MLFSYPPPYSNTYYQPNILTCKTCFKKLAEEYFSEFEDQYQELFNEVTKIKESDECSKKEWKYTKKRPKKFNRLTSILTWIQTI
jgi:hypothetical protein